MSQKLSTSVSTVVDSQCQHLSPKGNRCHMLIDNHHRPANGAQRPTLCAYHAERLRVGIPAVDVGKKFGGEDLGIDNGNADSEPLGVVGAGRWALRGGPRAVMVGDKHVMSVPLW